MRIHELVLKTIKPKPPLNLAQARVQGLKQNVERSKQQLKAEQERQHQQRNAQRLRKDVQRSNQLQ
jgi:hypothetical protein